MSNALSQILHFALSFLIGTLGVVMKFMIPLPFFFFGFGFLSFLSGEGFLSADLFLGNLGEEITFRSFTGVCA